MTHEWVEKAGSYAGDIRVWVCSLCGRKLNASGTKPLTLAQILEHFPQPACRGKGKP